jgi:multimeric flavodoxin WrbA
MINSSFRKNGNTQKILYKIGEQLQGEVDYINLHDYDINECKGCYQCMVKEEISCPNQDELNIVLKKMMNADLIVFGSPVYGRQINSTMKKFYDRITYHFHKPIFYDKKVINVAATELMGHGSTLKYMKLVSDNLAMRFIGNVSFSERFSFKNKNYHSKLDKRILNIVSKAEVDDHTPTMKQRIIFNKWKIRSILYQGKSEVIMLTGIKKDG